MGVAVASSRSGIIALVLFGLVALAASSDSGCQAGTDDDDDFDLGDDTEGLSICDGVVVVESPSGPVQLPGDTALFGSPESVDCALGDGGGDEEAVVALQTALVRCNGEDVAIDGEYGSQTADAVTRVQDRGGVAADGTFDPDTRRAMQWPTASADTTCVAGGSLGAVAEEAD